VPAITEQLPLPQRPVTTRGFTALTFLRRSATVWATVALIGQVVFALYVSAVYGKPALQGEFSRWSEGPVKTAWVAGDTAGNVTMGVHVGLAMLILLRRRWPGLHRWSGRAYLSAAMITSVAGVYLVWVRGAVGDLAQHIAITTNAVILLLCSVLAWRTARARDFAAHRRWALRTWVAASGVFFFRIYLMAWLLAWRAPVGFDAETFSGPFLTALAFGVYVVLPLLIVESYLRAERSAQSMQQWITGGVLALVTVVTAGGVVGATMGMWLPRM
jgi:hypothetical protein